MSIKQINDADADLLSELNTALVLTASVVQIK